MPYFPWGAANFLNIERAVEILPDKRYHLELVVESDICVLYVDGVALTSRMYARGGNQISVFSENGQVRLENIEVFTI